MTTFEYQRFVYEWDSDGTENLVFSGSSRGVSFRTGDTIDEIMDRMGQEGWDLVSSLFHPQSSLVCLIFKRVMDEA